MIHQPYLNASSSRNDKRYRREEGRVQDVSAGTVGESARDDDESKAKGSDE
jgi:hypothetical protein